MIPINRGLSRVSRWSRTVALTSWLAFVALSLTGSFAVGSTAPDPGASTGSPAQTANSCVSCHQTLGEEAALYALSVHAGSGISCSRCHGGNPAAADKAGAHSDRFVGKLDAGRQFSTCGSCHAAELNVFKTGKHFPERKGIAKLDCVQCHGTHMIGSPNRNFSYAYFCSGCHGLEYLPELNKPFQQMLMAADAENDSINELRRAGARLPEEALALRKKSRAAVGQIVHGTDHEKGLAGIPEILKQHEQFKLSLHR
jgi:hypothetical protein